MSRGGKRGLRSAQGTRNAHGGTMRMSGSQQFKSLYGPGGVAAGPFGPGAQVTADSFGDRRVRQSEHLANFTVDNIGVQDVSEFGGNNAFLRRMGSAQSSHEQVLQSDHDFNISQGNISSAQASGVGFPRQLISNQSEVLLRNHTRMNTILGGGSRLGN